MQPVPRPSLTRPPDSRPVSPPRAAFVALMGGNVALAFGPWLVRVADTGPVAAGFWRLALALPVLLLLTRVAKQPIPRMAPRVVAGLAIGGLFFAADVGLWHIGIRHTKLANATLFGNGASLFFAAYGLFAARLWPGRNQTIAMVLALTGVMLLLGRSYELSRVNLVGDLLCLAAGLLYTGYLIAIDRARGVLQPWPALAISTAAGVLPLLAFAFVLGERIVPHAWGPLILLAMGSQVIGQGLMVYAIGHLSPVVVGVGLLTQPAIAATIGWLAYGERLTAGDWIGAVLIGAAMVLVRREDGRG